MNNSRERTELSSLYLHVVLQTKPGANMVTTTCKLSLYQQASSTTYFRRASEWKCEITVKQINNKQQLKCLSENCTKQLCNETRQVCFQISKVATIITFDSRQRSKTLRGSRTLQTSGKAPHQWAPKIDTFLHFNHTRISAHLHWCIFHSAVYRIQWTWVQKIFPHLLRAENNKQN